MFGDNKKDCRCICSCHDRPFVSEMTIRIPYEQELNKLRHELYQKEQIIKDLAETNKHLSRRFKQKESGNAE